MSFKSSSASAPNLGAVENESPSSTKSLSHTELLHDTQTGSSMPESGINLAEEINSTSTLVLDRQNTKTKPVKEKWALSTSFGRLFKSASSASPSSSNSSLESEIDWRLILPSTHEQASLTYAAPGTIRRLKALHQSKRFYSCMRAYRKYSSRV